MGKCIIRTNVHARFPDATKNTFMHHANFFSSKNTTISKCTIVVIKSSPFIITILIRSVPLAFTIKVYYTISLRIKQMWCLTNDNDSLKH